MFPSRVDLLSTLTNIPLQCRRSWVTHCPEAVPSCHARRCSLHVGVPAAQEEVVGRLLIQLTNLHYIHYPEELFVSRL